MKPRAVVLLSGGIDSSVALALAKAEGNEVYTLAVNYGQRHVRELQCALAQSIAQKAVEHRCIEVNLSHLGTPLLDAAAVVPRDRTDDGQVAPTYVPARNSVLLSLALGWAEVLGAEDLYIGVNLDDSTGYPDCRPFYLHAFERLAETATKAGCEGRAFRVRAPLISMRKHEIVKLGFNLGVDFSMTSSCYDPTEAGACGSCDSCRLRLLAFNQAKLKDPIPYRSAR